MISAAKALYLKGDYLVFGVNINGDARAYERGTQTFEPTNLPISLPGHLRAGNTTWKISEAALIAPDGTSLPRVPGHISYWFAWDGYMGFSSEFYGN